MIRLKVREIAEAQGYNMSTLSRQSNVSFSTVKRVWKDPEKMISLDLLEKLAKTLNVSVHDFIEELPG